MYDYEKGELEKLGLPKRLVRFELSGEYGDPARDPAFPREAIGRDLTVTVLFRGQKKTLSCPSQKSLLRAMEEAGIAAPSDCRSGICGWCRSRLVSGEVFMPEEADGRRAADRKFGWIHPCAAYPLTDVTLEVFPLSE
jgi:ferredoxin